MSFYSVNIGRKREWPAVIIQVQFSTVVLFLSREGKPAVVVAAVSVNMLSDTFIRHTLNLHNT